MKKIATNGGDKIIWVRRSFSIMFWGIVPGNVLSKPLNLLHHITE